MNNLDNKTNKLKHLFGLVTSMFFVIMGILLIIIHLTTFCI